MLSKFGKKVHPQHSLQSSCTIIPPSPNCGSKAEDYNYLPSPDAANVEPVTARCSHWRLFSNYPRFSFVVLFVVCTYLGGIYVSTKVTTWTLDALGVHKQLSAARQMYVTTSRVLNTMTECVDQRSLEYLASAKIQFEVDSNRVQKVIDANDEGLANQQNATMICSENFLTSLRKQVNATTWNDANSTISCFSDSFHEHLFEAKAISFSRAILLAVRTILTTQAVSSLNGSISEQQTQVENQSKEMWNAVDTIKKSIDKTLEVAELMASKELSSLTPILGKRNGISPSKQVASQLGRLGKLASSGLSDSLTSASSTSLENIRKAGRTLHKALELLAGLHDGFASVLGTMDETWGLVEEQFNATVQQVAKLQKELEYAVESTTQQVSRTSAAVMTSLNQTHEEISNAFDILQEKWQDTFKQVVGNGFAPWQRLGDQLVAELTANQRQSIRPSSSIQRKFVLPDRKSNLTLDQTQARLPRNKVWLNVTSPATVNKDEFDIDTAVLRASLIDISVFMTQVIFYLDVGRLTLLAADLAVGLITESYSDMPMLDFRGITTVDTIGSVCEVFLCQHSLAAICYTLVAKISELMYAFVAFLIAFGTAFIVNAGLFMWKQDHKAHCGFPQKTTTSPTVIQKLTRIYFENSGNKSNFIVDPLDEIEKYATIINDSIRNDYGALRLDAAVVWRNQSALLDDLNDFSDTTSSLFRMLQHCTEIDNTSMSVALAYTPSQCLTRAISNTSKIIPLPSVTEKLSKNALFFVRSTTASCFPSDGPGREHIVTKLQHDLSCATEKAVYLSISSWWLLAVIFFANRFVVRMIIKAAGMYWWRCLSANRLHFIGFCAEDGDIVDSGEKLSTAIKQHLQQAKWLIVGRFVGIGCTFICVCVVITTTFVGVV